MQLDIKNIVKDQILFLIIPCVALVISIALFVYSGFVLVSGINTYNEKTKEYNQAVEKKKQLQERLNAKMQETASTDLKQIVEFKSSNFGVSATFAPLFEDMLSIAKESGIRIRSVNNNYSPANDLIFNASIPGHNVCELTMTVVGTYEQLQRFLKVMSAQTYLVNIAKVETISWYRDRSVLIANLALRFYTKTK